MLLIFPVIFSVLLNQCYNVHFLLGSFDDFCAEGYSHVNVLKIWHFEGFSEIRLIMLAVKSEFSVHPFLSLYIYITKFTYILSILILYFFKFVVMSSGIQIESVCLTGKNILYYVVIQTRTVFVMITDHCWAWLFCIVHIYITFLTIMWVWPSNIYICYFLCTWILIFYNKWDYRS